MYTNLHASVNKLDVSLATSKDTEQIIQLLKQVAGWLKEIGLNQWNYVIDGNADESIKQSINKRETFIVRERGKIVATFILLEEQGEWDKQLWGERNDESAYLHKFAVARSGMGKNMGGKIIEWILNYLKHTDKTHLRLDCIAENTTLNIYYVNQGLQKVGCQNGFSLYEKMV